MCTTMLASCSSMAWTQGFVPVRQVLYQLSFIPSPLGQYFTFLLIIMLFVLIWFYMWVEEMAIGSVSMYIQKNHFDISLRSCWFCRSRYDRYTRPHFKFKRCITYIWDRTSCSPGLPCTQYVPMYLLLLPQSAGRIRMDRHAQFLWGCRSNPQLWCMGGKHSADGDGYVPSLWCRLSGRHGSRY